MIDRSAKVKRIWETVSLILILVVVIALLISDPQYAPNSGTWERLSQHLRSISIGDIESSASIVVPYVANEGTRYWVRFVPVSARIDGRQMVALVPLSYSKIRDHVDVSLGAEGHLANSPARFSAIAKEIGLVNVPALEASGDIRYYQVESVVIQP